MMPELVGNLLVAQSGGPTAVINSSVAGVIQEAGRHGEIEEIYGGLNGIWGILNEDLIDLNEEMARTIEGLKGTPAAALGTCRYKLDFKKNAEQAGRDMDRIFQVLQAHNIRYFFYVGGNDSQDTASKIHQRAQETGYELRVIGVPKTIDNDLPHTDHCPGYGSVTKYNATTVMEIAADVGSMATDEGSCVVVELMGREAGWIAAGTVLAKRKAEDAPHIILLPEIPFDESAFLKRVADTVTSLKYCIVVVGEGLKDQNGNALAADTSRLDAFGHPALSGMGEYLADLVKERLELKSRSVKLGYAQRAASHFASATDVAEAAACGEAAVRAAIQGQSGFMVKLVRRDGSAYSCTTDLQPLADIANQVKLIPREWIQEDGFLPNETFIQYARPLIEGEIKVAVENGLPKYAALDRVRIEKTLPARS
jgi:ATP-dependent phosphofructokinase / diphosphate-dependent phosphofructokinase